MQFSVIYSVDVPRDVSIKHYMPSQRHLFTQTEGDSQYDYEYLDGPWRKGKHRKLCAVLTREQFDRFVLDCGLDADSTETTGSIGAPGFGYGWAPAIAFNGADYDAITSCYVTPVPKRITSREKPIDDVAWKRIRNAMLAVY